MTCRKGDIAIVVRANHDSNLGMIVRILDVDDSRGDLAFKKDSLVWRVSSAYPMTWSKNGRIYRRTEGPVPDRNMQPIRGVDRLSNMEEVADKRVGLSELLREPKVRDEPRN